MLQQNTTARPNQFEDRIFLKLLKIYGFRAFCGAATHAWVTIHKNTETAIHLSVICRRIHCFSRHSLSLPLDCHKFIWEVRLRCNSVFEEEFSSNSSKFPQIQEIFLKLKLLRKCSHTPPLLRQTRAKPPSVDYRMFFLSTNPHDPTAHCNIPM